MGHFGLGFGAKTHQKTLVIHFLTNTLQIVYNFVKIR